MVRRAFRSMLDEVLEGEAVLLDSGHRLVKQVLQADRLTLLLACRGREMIQVKCNSYNWLEIFLQLCIAKQAMRVRIRIPQLLGIRFRIRVYES